MSSKLDITFGKIGKTEKGTLIAFATEGGVLSDTAAELNNVTDGALERAISVSEFEGKNGTFIDLTAPANTDLSRILIVGLGDVENNPKRDWAALGGKICGRLGKHDKPVTITAAMTGDEDDPFTPENIAEIAFGLLLRSYTFDKYKTDKGKPRKNESKFPEKVQFQCFEAAKVRKCFSALKSVSDGVFLARDLVNEPANILGPVEFAEKIEELQELGAEVEILDDKALKRQKMNAILAVGQGSARPSRLAVIKWNGGKKKSEAPVAFVGKGVTFDTGGISLKPAFGMEDMKGDMAGAACVAGLMHTLASRKAKVNAVGIIGLVENMPGSNAQRPGDIVTSMSGQTIEVINTDAEGRLVLADAIWYCQEKFKPQFVINLATLTGAVMVALGSEYAGLFSNDDDLAEKLSDVSKKTGEKVWRLPLGSKYDKMIDSKIADMKNSGGRYAGSITAAQFLKRFVQDGTPWTHLDIAGTGMAVPKSDINTSWGPGFGVRLLNRLVQDHYED